MATKKQIAEQAMRILSGGHLKVDRTMDIRELMLALDQLRDARMQLDVFNNVKMGEYSVDEDYLTIYEGVAVSSGAGELALDYATLPANVVSLYGGLGIYQVTPDDDPESAYMITKVGMQGLLSGTSALDNDQNTYCWIVGERMYFKNNTESTVTMILAVSSKEIAEDADYPVPPNVEADLLKELVQLFSVQSQTPHDEAEDGIK